MCTTRIACFAVVSLFAITTDAAIVLNVQDYGPGANLNGLFSQTDLIHGMIGTELPGDHGWHPANTDPLDQLPALTDGAGIRQTGLTGLMNDFPGEGQPTKRIQYDLVGAADIESIRVISGNNGLDGRVFHTYTVSFSSNNGGDWSDPFYVQPHPSGTVNNGERYAVMSELGETSGTLAADVTNIRFDFYTVDNTAGVMRDAFDGVNPFTGVDDGLTPAFVASLIWEIDVLEVPEPASLFLIACGGLLIRRRALLRPQPR